MDYLTPPGVTASPVFSRVARDAERRRTEVSAARVATLNTGRARGYDPDAPTARRVRDPIETTDR